MKNLTSYFIVLFTICGFQLFAQNAVLVENQKLTVTNLGGDNYTVGNNAELRITAPVSGNGKVDLVSDSGWLILDGVLPSEAIVSHFSYITINGQPAVKNVNTRVTNYLRGCAIMAHSPIYEALTLYKDAAYTGEQMKCIPYKYYKIADLGSFDNTVTSFKLKKGYMATFAQNENGTGFSKVFIADAQDIEISTLQVGLNDKVSFVRVFPWMYSDKKGFGSGLPDFKRTIIPVKLTNSGWFYHWGTTSAEDLTDVEFVPTRWNAKSLTDTRWKEILDINYSSHLLGFNEPDGAEQANMTLDEMLLYWPKMLESGMRLGSPAMASDLNLLYSFIDKCDELNYRVDFVAMHDYGTGTAQQFYNKCKAIHDRTGRPIWIKEFNWGGTWTRPTPTYPQISARVAEIMEKYDTAGIIERYSIFNFDETVNNFGGVQNRAVFVTPAIPDYTFTPLGIAYRDNVSPMAFNPLGQINIPLKLVAPQNLTITNSNGRVNKLVWNNFNFTGIGNLFIECADGAGTFVPIAQINSNTISYDDDISATGLIKYTYRISVRETGFANSKSVVGSIDLSTSVVFNVALNKPATASSTLSTLYPASNAVDGNATADASRWVNSRGVVPAIIEIDLQDTYLISRMNVYTGLSGSNNPLTSFTFDYWDENTQSWTAAVTETNNAISAYSNTFSEVKTNKVRLHINATADNTVRLFELEVYGRRISTLSTDDFSATNFIIYPNPTSKLLFLSGNTAIESSEIFEANGKKLIEKKSENVVDVSQLAAGIYFIKVNNTETFKFIKK
ncbi:glycosyl hydrolase [Flavobacterium sp.]|uniref:glycosyl hydrolase n=1 Tax=Flavobacterium sp. TaxID=239 RepID=UPI00286E7BBD|nr:glycosyl hydrolase [Flavobacterium sp.]